MVHHVPDPMGASGSQQMVTALGMLIQFDLVGCWRVISLRPSCWEWGTCAVHTGR